MFEAAIDLNAVTTPTAVPALVSPARVERSRPNYARYIPVTRPAEWKLTPEQLRPTTHDRALAKIRKFLKLERNWDGEGGSTVDRRAVAMAEAVLSAATSMNVRLEPSVGGTGTIFLHPRECVLDGEITIGSEGDLLALLEDGDGSYDIETEPGETVPAELLGVLRRAGRSTQIGTTPLAA